MTKVTVYYAGKVRATRNVPGESSDESIAAIENIMSEEKLTHCAARLEDEFGKGACWLFIPSIDKAHNGFDDAPKGVR